MPESDSASFCAHPGHFWLASSKNFEIFVIFCVIFFVEFFKIHFQKSENLFCKIQKMCFLLLKKNPHFPTHAIDLEQVRPKAAYF